MSAMEFTTALDDARTLAFVEEINRFFLGAVAAGALGGEDAERIDAAVAAARQRVKAAAEARTASSRRSPSPPRRRREKVFGDGRPRPMDRNGKARVMHLARALMRRTEAGKAYGVIKAKAFIVLEILLWGFHNAKSGLCFPSYEKIAERAGCARSTVAEALKALEAANILTWVNRVVRIREQRFDALGRSTGTRWRVIRTSNGYAFRDPKGAAEMAIASKSEKPSGTTNQVISLLEPALSKSLERLKNCVFGAKTGAATA